MLAVTVIIYCISAVRKIKSYVCFHFKIANYTVKCLSIYMDFHRRCDRDGDGDAIVARYATYLCKIVQCSSVQWMRSFFGGSLFFHHTHEHMYSFIFRKFAYSISSMLNWAIEYRQVQVDIVEQKMIWFTTTRRVLLCAV